MDTSALTRTIPKPPYPVEWFAPQYIPTPSFTVALYLKMDKNDKYNFIKSNPHFFALSGEGYEYLDIRDRIRNENKRNLNYLYDELNGITDTILDKEAVRAMIEQYKALAVP